MAVVATRTRTRTEAVIMSQRILNSPGSWRSQIPTSFDRQYPRITHRYLLEHKSKDKFNANHH